MGTTWGRAQTPFPGPTQPGTSAQDSSTLDNATLDAGALSARVAVQNERFGGLLLDDHLAHRTLRLDEAFVLVLKDQTILRSTQMKLTRIADSAVPDPHHPVRTGYEQAPARSCWQFTTPAVPVDLQWCLVAPSGSGYVRELLRITAQGTDLPIAEVRMLQFADPAAHVEGTVKGSPIVDEGLFLGIEHPLSISNVQQGMAKASMFRELPLRTSQSITYTAVLGAAAPGQMRRAFSHYIEAERPRPYQPFLHYNTWFDLGYGNRFDEAGVLDRIHAFGEQLVVQRHVQLDSLLLDDGWDDPHTLWGFNPGFPDGLTKVVAAAAKYGAGIGVWLSPWGGYDEEKKQRIAYGQAHGYEILNGGYALSGPKYFERFEATCLAMVTRFDVNQFKLDGTGNADKVFPGSAFDSDFDAAIHVIERLRQQKPGLFINLTTGTTASPFWLFYADSIWRGGEDHDFSGQGTARQRWITYRDAQTYKNIVRQGPLFPLNSLMLHGVIYASKAKDVADDPAHDFADEVHSFFGSGTQLQELYITPSLLSAENWDTLAEAARWSRAHSETLKDTHWIGGDPDQMQVYGWAAWSPQMGLITLRNPAKTTQSFQVELAKDFELQSGDAGAYNPRTVWDSADAPKRTLPRTLHKGETFSIELAPFEVVTFEARPAGGSSTPAQ